MSIGRKLFLLTYFLACGLRVTASPPLGIAPSALTHGEQLQAVIDRGGPIVYVPRETYQQDVPLRLRSNLALFCEIGTIIKTEVILDGAENLSIYNCQFENPDPAPLAVSVNLEGNALLGTHIAKGWPNRPTIDARCSPGQATNLSDCYESIRKTAKAGVGRYISGSRVQATVTDFPPEAVLESALPAGSLLAYGSRNYADIRKPAVLTSFADAINSELLSRTGPTVLIDNIVHPSADATWPFPWAQTCELLSKLRKPDRKIIANIAGASWGFADADCNLLDGSVDGMAFEMPFHKTARENAANAKRQIDVYRRWLEAGKTVVLIPVDGSLTADADKDAEASYIAAFAMIVRKPTQPMHVATPYFKFTPEWAMWPVEWGSKKGDCSLDGTTIVQGFDNGTLRISPPRDVVWTPSPPASVSLYNVKTPSAVWNDLVWRK